MPPGVACLLLELAAATTRPISRSGGVHNNQRVQRPGSKRSRLPRLRRWSGLGVGGPQRTATTEHASDQGSLNPGPEHEAFDQPAAAPAGAVGHFQSLVREFEDGQDSDAEVINRCAAWCSSVKRVVVEHSYPTVLCDGCDGRSGSLAYSRSHLKVLFMPPGVACLLLELAAATTRPISRSGGVHNNQRVQRPGSRRSRLPRLRRRSGLGVGGPQDAATTEPTFDGGQYQWQWHWTEDEPFEQPAAATAGTGQEVYQQVRGLVFKCEASGRVAGAMGAGTLGRWYSRSYLWQVLSVQRQKELFGCVL
jgi:hypothetical protein